MDLLGDSSGEEEDKAEIKINTENSYANKYDAWRQKEHLQKLKDKYGDDYEEESESEESSDDSEAEELNEENEKEFFATLASLKKKDPKIYDGQTEFFKGETVADSGGVANKIAKVKKEKKVTLADVERQVMLEKGGHFDEMEDKSLKYGKDMSYNDEMKSIKDSFKAALNDDEEEEETLLEKKTKTVAEKLEDEAEYKSWLAGQRSSISDPEMEKKLSGLRDFWNKDDLDEGEKFLKDFLLNKRFLESDKEGYVPSYDEIAHDSDENLSEDEKNVEDMEEFEHKFNFRFEEPDEEFIKRYPRTIKGTMRKNEDKRAKKRKEVEERKKQEKVQKKEEIKMLKNAKKKEILDKLDKLKKITGNDDMELDDDDIEGDFDPEKYDKKMKEVFSKYDETATPDMEKPTFSDLDDEDYDDEDTEDWDNWTGPEPGGEGGDEEQHCEDEEFNMDCEYDASKAMEKEIIESTKGRRKSRRKSKFAEAIETSVAKPVFDPTDKTFEQYVEEYYKLDCEDMIDDLPCRFKYRSVPVNDFGLSVEEVLGAKDSELNAWASLRKTCQYRTEQDERKDFHVFKNKSKDINLKKKILPTLFEPEEDTLDKEDTKTETKSAKKRNRKKRKLPIEDVEDGGEKSVKKNKAEENVVNNTSTEGTKPKVATESIETEARKTTETATSPKKKKKKSKKKKDGAANTNGAANKNVLQINKIAGIFEKSKTFSKNTNKKKKEDSAVLSDDRLKAYGVNPNKFKRAQKKEFFKKAAVESK